MSSSHCYYRKDLQVEFLCAQLLRRICTFSIIILTLVHYIPKTSVIHTAKLSRLSKLSTKKHLTYITFSYYNLCTHSYTRHTYSFPHIYKLYTLKLLSNYKNYVTIHLSPKMFLKIWYGMVVYQTPDTEVYKRKSCDLKVS
jgi:hypothetical protein